jgi:lipoyl(octanoyl) transferase
MRFIRAALHLFFGGCCALVRDCRPTRPQYCSTTILQIAPQQLGEFESLNFADRSKRKVVLLDFVSENPVPFREAWDMQKSILNAHMDRINSGAKSPQFADERGANGTDTVILLQHQAVYTLGTASDENFILSSDDTVPVIRMDRGGEVTYHGPGQLTIYPILDLRGYKQDIHWYIRALEEATIRALACFGLQAKRQDGITGVWVDDFKVAAVGIKCRKWVTMHGLAINVDASSLRHFGGIVACGLENRRVGCVNQFLSEGVVVKDVADAIVVALEEVLQIELIRSITN